MEEFAPQHRAVRVAVDGAPEWGRLEGDAIVLTGPHPPTRVPESEATYLAPAEPTKIIAVHLTYQSRLTEYAAKGGNGRRVPGPVPGGGEYRDQPGPACERAAARVRPDHQGA